MSQTQAIVLACPDHGPVYLVVGAGWGDPLSTEHGEWYAVPGANKPENGSMMVCPRCGHPFVPAPADPERSDRDAGNAYLLLRDTR